MLPRASGADQTHTIEYFRSIACVQLSHGRSDVRCKISQHKLHYTSMVGLTWYGCRRMLDLVRTCLCSGSQSQNESHGGSPDPKSARNYQDPDPKAGDIICYYNIRIIVRSQGGAAIWCGHDEGQQGDSCSLRIARMRPLRPR